MFKVIFLGTGVSTAIPSLYHIIVKENKQCPVCLEASTNINSKNRRNNVSIAITFNEPNTNNHKCLIIDIGKTMRDSFLNILPKHNINEINSIILTHGHADACLGLDDVRDLQSCSKIAIPDPNNNNQSIYGFRIDSGPIDIILHQETMDTIHKQFGYLTEVPPYLDEANFILERRIALLNFKVIDPNEYFDLHGLPVRAFPVYHGGRFISLGFSIGKPGEFVYISDVKIIPEETILYLKSIDKINTLVLDCLDVNGIYSHIGLNEAKEIISLLKPENVYFVGMSCGIGFHDNFNETLKSEVTSCNCCLAYDGLVIDGFALA